MKPPAALCLLAFLSLSAQNARADAVRIPATFSTSGLFDCRSTIVCSGEGTSSITFGSGANTATLTFTGVETSIDVTNQLQPVSLGEFRLTATEGFTFPTHPANPALPILHFGIQLDQTTTIDSSGGRGWEFGPGGRENLKVEMGIGYFGRPVGPSPFKYTDIVYTVKPFPFTLAPNSTTSLSADVGAVPEPTSVLVLGTGLVGTIIARRRARRAPDSRIRTPESAT
jgi:hypothetical protein